jgi:hypothetical protein
MDYSVFSKKVRLITFSLIIPLQIDLQASEEELEASVPPQRPIKILPFLRGRETSVCSATRGTLTPKEIQIASRARRRFFQLSNNNPACKSPSIDLWAIAELNRRIHNGEVVRGQPISLVYNRLKQIATQFSPNACDPFTVKVDPSLV